ncbi:DUF6695 family protein [Psychroserpens sp. XS_ASV72]|uniref:DUF6695 family protein n=1 Tax=Psychroserpens sp. XS_ASV72 TaxID=3241293 RepID=UPI003511E8A9
MNDGIILTLAYPETIVSHAEEWYSPLLKYVSIGNKNYVRAGHAALILIDKATGVLEYHDFGRYITASPYGRVRGKETDFELNFPIKATIQNNKITNTKDILKYFASIPELTHGDGKLYASVCNAIDYQKARSFIDAMQHKGLIRYAAFIKDASNCARFVADTLIASVTDEMILSQLKKSKWFTPSTIGNVILADTENDVYVVSENGNISEFKSNIKRENRKYFLDRLKHHESDWSGKLEPKHNSEKSDHAQWLGGIAAGAWFEIHDIGSTIQYRFRRISPYGDINCDGIYQINMEGFDLNSDHNFIHYSNCRFFQIRQGEMTYRFDYIKNFND